MILRCWCAERRIIPASQRRFVTITTVARARIIRSETYSAPPSRGGRVKGESRAHNVPGYFTVSQVARKLELPNPWVYARIYNGTIQVTKDAGTGLYLFPDDPATIERFRELKEGKIQKLRF